MSKARTHEEMMIYEKDVPNRIATITLNRPDKMNAPDSAMRMRYAQLLSKANIDDDVKVLIVRGEGEHFGTGADLPEMFEKLETDPLFEFGLGENPDVQYPPKGSFRHEFNISSHYASVRSSCRSLQEFKKISIVEVKGYCMAGISTRRLMPIWS